MSHSTPTSPQTKKSMFAFFGNGRGVWFVALGLAIATLLGVFMLLSQATATSTYYVLGQPVAARTAITGDMLVPVTTSDGSQPGNAYDLTYVQSNTIYARYPLQRGDVVSASNAGPEVRLTEDLPPNFVAASFTVDASNAVGGKVRPGDFIDIIAQDEGSGVRVAKVVLSRVYVLDATVSADNLSDGAGEVAEGEDSPQQGVPALYTVALSVEDAVTIAQIRDKAPYVVLSSIEATPAVDVARDLVSIFTPGAIPSSSSGVATPSDPDDPATDPGDQ